MRLSARQPIAWLAPRWHDFEARLQSSERVIEVR